MSDEPQKADALRDLVNSLNWGDRVIIEKKNALGGMDAHYMPATGLAARITTLEAERDELREALGVIASGPPSPSWRTPMTEKRSFPEAGNGLPDVPMEAELWAAGCDLETARFVAIQLAAQGYTLVRAKLEDDT